MATTDSIRVLHVDDEPDLAELTATFLEREDDRITVRIETSVESGLDAVANADVDCIVSDYDMPGVNGIRFLEAVRREHPTLPFVLYTGKGSEEVASDAISAGATEYLQKGNGTDQYRVLSNRIVNAVEQRRAESARRETERRLSQLTGHSPDVLWMFTADWDELLFVNEPVEEVYGLSTEDLESNARAFLGAIHPADRDRVERSMSRISDGQSGELEYRVNEDEEFRRWVWVKGTPIVDGTGTVTRIVGFSREITDRKEREGELQRTRDILERTEHIADVGGWEIDTETRDVFWTDHLFDLFDVDGPAEPRLEGALDMFLEADRSVVRNAVETALASGERFDVDARLRRPGGTIRWIRILGDATVEDGEVISLRGAAQDITDQRERERTLERAHEEYEELFNGMNDSAWVIDFDERFRAVNDAAVARTGYSRAELLSMGPRDIDRGLEGGEISALIEELPEDELQVFETVHEAKDGERIPVEISSSLISYRDETAVLSIARDVSDRRQREKQLEEFASVVSHDLRNPLNVAQGRLEIARSERDSEHLEVVASAHDRMADLITDLLTLAREGRGVSDREAVDLGSLVERCWGNVSTKEATLRTECEGTILADPSRLQQLVENLVHNAVEHGGERVTVTVGWLEDGFYVEDDGPGIPEVDRGEVFTAGYTTSRDGTGFGLSIVARIAAAHGWEIRVSEGTEGGARFEITGVVKSPT